jgi:hypothetical protein
MYGLQEREEIRAMAVADSDPSTTKPKPRSDAYTGMLIISLIALLAGAALLYLDYSKYPGKEPPKISPSPRSARNQ